MTIQGTTLNPADIATGAGTFPPNLSNGNLTCTGANGSNNECSIRSVASAGSGKFQFSVTVGALGGFTPGLGIVATGQNLAAFGATSANWPGGLVWLNSGAIYRNGVANVATWSGYTTGSKLTFAVDVDKKLIWGQVNGGPWNKSLSASPSLGIGGLDFSALGATVSPVVWMNDFGGGASSVTMDFSQPDQLPANATTLMVWARGIKQIPGTSLWGPGNWTNVFAGTLPGGPEQGTGGVYMGGPNFQPNSFTPVYLTAYGTGDGGVQMTSAPPFRAMPPRGFAWGWPNPAGGPGGGFDSASAQGSASFVNGGTSVSFPTVNGLCQSQVGVTQGAYYIEYTITADIFSQSMGIGAGRKGPQLAAWANGGGFSTTDNDGGCMVNAGTNGNGFQASLLANTVQGPNIPDFATPPGTAVGVAILVTNDFAAAFAPQPFMPTPLVCVPCSELILPNQRFLNRFGA